MSLRRLGALALTIIETVLIYAGIPALIIVVIVGLVYVGDMRRGGDKRYRPGRPFEFRPVWFLSAPGHATAAGSPDHRALTGGAAPAALTAGASSGTPARVDEWPGTEAAQQSTTGGASDRW
jgi:hypothetical protein